MQSWHDEVATTSGRQSKVGDVSHPNLIVDNASVQQRRTPAYSCSEASESYARVCQQFRFTLHHPRKWIWQRANRMRRSYGLVLLWSVTGCVIGLGVVMLRHHLMPSVNLPAANDMNAVFVIHDLNEVILPATTAVRAKS